MFIHFTKSLQALDSIVKSGFLYLHNENEVIRPALLDAFGVSDCDDQSNGMICFTEVAPEETFLHQSKFGCYGVGISRGWLIANGAKKVEYVEVRGKRYFEYVELLKNKVPTSIRDERIDKLRRNPEKLFLLKSYLSGSLWNKQDFKENKEYIDILRMLEWTQTNKHIAESEWRIRNPEPYRFEGNPTRKQQIEMLISCINNKNIQDHFEGLIKYTIDGKVTLNCVGKLSLVLRLPSQMIGAFFITKDDYGKLKNALEESRLGHIPIYVNTGNKIELY